MSDVDARVLVRASERAIAAAAERYEAWGRPDDAARYGTLLREQDSVR